MNSLPALATCFHLANYSTVRESLYFGEELPLDLIGNVVPVNLHECALKRPKEV